MKKKVALTAAAVALVGTLAVGGTLAWFTDTETATNVVKMGKVDIVLKETGKDAGAVNPDGLEYSNVMPGDKFQKMVTIENKGNDAYVRAKIVVSGEDVVLKTFSDNDPDNDIKFLNDGKQIKLEKINNKTWTETTLENGQKGYYATVNYDKMFTNGIAVVFKEIEIPGAEWGNKYVDQNFNIKVIAEAVQSKNFTTADQAFGALNGSVADLPNDKNTLEIATPSHLITP